MKLIRRRLFGGPYLAYAIVVTHWRWPYYWFNKLCAVYRPRLGFEVGIWLDKNDTVRWLRESR